MRKRPAQCWGVPKFMEVFYRVFANPLIRVKVKGWWFFGGRVQPQHSLLRRSGNPISLALTSRHYTAMALWSCCHGDVGQSTDVQEQRGFGFGRGLHAAQAGAGSKLQLNVGQ